EVLGAGALEAEDRLLVVADDEDRSQLTVALPFAGEEIVGQRADDRPLRGVGVLRFVDQDVVELPVELVADPRAKSRLRQQPSGPADQIIEIDQSFALLGLVPRQRKTPADGERRRQKLDKRQQSRALADRLERRAHPLRHAGVVHVELLEALEPLGLALLREE